MRVIGIVLTCISLRVRVCNSIASYSLGGEHCRTHPDGRPRNHYIDSADVNDVRADAASKQRRVTCNAKRLTRSKARRFVRNNAKRFVRINAKRLTRNNAKRVTRNYAKRHVRSISDHGHSINVSKHHKCNWWGRVVSCTERTTSGGDARI